MFDILDTVQAGKHEDRLIDDLLKPYQIYERPVAEEEHAVKLQFSIALQVINSQQANIPILFIFYEYSGGFKL